MPLFERSEFLSRLRLVKRAMADRDIDLLLVASPANQNWLTAFPAVGNQVNNRLIAFGTGPIYLVIMVKTLDANIGRNAGHIQLVDFREFTSFRQCRSGHTGKFAIHAEIILEGDRSDCLVFRLASQLSGTWHPVPVRFFGW